MNGESKKSSSLSPQSVAGALEINYFGINLEFSYIV